MAEFTIEKIKEHAVQITKVFEDGFQIADVFTVIEMAMKIVDAVEGMTGEEKKATALKIIEYVIDETDIPWLPDSLIDPILKKIAPRVIEMVIDASKGKTVNAS